MTVMVTSAQHTKINEENLHQYVWSTGLLRRLLPKNSMDNIRINNVVFIVS